MKNILKLEQLTLFIVIFSIYTHLNFSWVWFAVLFFTPDLAAIGYFFGNKIGAICYNIAHNYIISILTCAIGYFYNLDTVLMVGLIITSHIAFDRILGYGLKKYDGFKFTHLGNI
ncbi:DUF4260 domain-containing protein [Faecalibacter bovis]|uniref:DUF4260 domain-containing protein n=1 Tax=Faecalibacter bovis TaxID=2898187 RepID=A0ABX7XEQ2_9FLAO|nr:DUF4260 domain-containing protein [Faecalibacter bovis]QTV06341.1 DUF4260 domain-containing protein [Faecalibacter bovis]